MARRKAVLPADDRPLEEIWAEFLKLEAESRKAVVRLKKVMEQVLRAKGIAE